MYIFFDCKVSSYKDPEAVSIGLISENGSRFYAELDNGTVIDETIEKAVTNGLEYELIGPFIGETTYEKFGIDHVDIAMKDEDSTVVSMLGKWLNQFDEDDKVVTVCDTPTLKWMAFMRLINNDREILSAMGMKPIDITTLFYVAGYDTTTNRLKYLEENGPLSYNALAHAELTRDCFESLMDEIEGNKPDTWKQCDKCGRLCPEIDIIDDVQCCANCKRLTMDEMLR